MADLDLRFTLVAFAAVIISLTVHEFAHAFVADFLGDKTPRRFGRLTLNPAVLMKAHPFGALLVPLMGAFTGVLIGWAATPISPAQLKRGVSVRTGFTLVTAAGPLSNFLLAVISALLFVFLAPKVGDITWLAPLASGNPEAMGLLPVLLSTNLFFFVFNLLPVPPLDGFAMLQVILPRKAVEYVMQYSMFLILLVFMSAGRLIVPVVRFLAESLISFATALVG